MLEILIGDLRPAKETGAGEGGRMTSHEMLQSVRRSARLVPVVPG